MPGPLARTLRHGLREAALALKGQRSRGHVPARLWVGLPGGAVPTQVALFDTADLRPREELDDGSRTELALALAHVVQPAVPEPMFWLTRTGDPDLCAPDHAWIRSVWAACDVLEVPRWFAVVTRTGWRHVPSGEAHHWKRLRA